MADYIEEDNSFQFKEVDSRKIAEISEIFSKVSSISREVAVLKERAELATTYLIELESQIAFCVNHVKENLSKDLDDFQHMVEELKGELSGNIEKEQNTSEDVSEFRQDKSKSLETDCTEDLSTSL